MRNSVQTAKKRRTPKAWLKRYGRVILGAAVVGIMVLFSIFGPMLTPYDPYKTDMSATMQAPSAQHWFGTDEFGRDYFTRLAYGGRITIAIALSAQLLIVLAGTVNGLLCGYYRHYDAVSMRVMEALYSLPNMLVVLMIAALIGQGIGSVLIALVVGGLPGITRNIRGQVLNLRAMEFIEAEKAMGASAPRTIFLHILPQTFNYLVIRFSTGISTSVLTIASMSYLGIGLSPNVPNWGGMISQSQNLMLIYPNLVIWPGVAIALVVFGFSMLGEGVRDILDPKYR